MRVGELKALLKDVNDDVEVVVKNFLLAGEVIHLKCMLSVVEDDGNIPAALIADRRSQESVMSAGQRNEFPVWTPR